MGARVSEAPELAGGSGVAVAAEEEAGAGGPLSEGSSPASIAGDVAVLALLLRPREAALDFAPLALLLPALLERTGEADEPRDNAEDVPAPDARLAAAASLGDASSSMSAEDGADAAGGAVLCHSTTGRSRMASSMAEV